MRTAAIAARATPQSRLAMCLAVVLVDQASKAVQPSGGFVVNTGSAALLPPAVGDALWNSPTMGAACDTVDTVVLLVALSLARRCASAVNRAAALAVVAGLLSNLVDRLGASSLFHAGLPRGSIDWIPVPLWASARTNVADVAIGLGVLVIGTTGVRHAAAAINRITHRNRAARLVAMTLCIALLAGWTTYWQANRQAAVAEPPSPSKMCSFPTDPSNGITLFGPC
jgi:signal peptidase (SPase) II